MSGVSWAFAASKGSSRKVMRSPNGIATQIHLASSTQKSMTQLRGVEGSQDFVTGNLRTLDEARSPGLGAGASACVAQAE